MVHFLFVNQLLFIGTTELLLIGGIALLLFGGKKLPEMMRGLGEGVREFKKGVNDAKETDENPNNEEVEKKESEENPSKDELKNDANLMTFGGHLEVLRRMLFRIIAVAGTLSVIVFTCKETIWRILLAPSEYSFTTYTLIENAASLCGYDFHFEKFHVDLIATDLSSQFMTHVTTSVYLGLLGASPYILYELFRFVSPALYENEKKYSVSVAIVIYLLFIVGVLMSYYVLFPISFRFLGTYSVSETIRSTITLDSYIETFTTLTFVMGVVFQLPVIMFFLAKMGFISSQLLAKYRKHALIVIMIVAAIITPPDLMTLVLVTIPLYLLYEVSVRIAKIVESK